MTNEVAIAWLKHTVNKLESPTKWADSIIIREINDVIKLLIDKDNDNT